MKTKTTSERSATAAVVDESRSAPLAAECMTHATSPSSSSHRGEARIAQPPSVADQEDRRHDREEPDHVGASAWSRARPHPAQARKLCSGHVMPMTAPLRGPPDPAARAYCPSPASLMPARVRHEPRGPSRTPVALPALFGEQPLTASHALRARAHELVAPIPLGRSPVRRAASASAGRPPPSPHPRSPSGASDPVPSQERLDRRSVAIQRHADIPDFVVVPTIIERLVVREQPRRRHTRSPRSRAPGPPA